MSLCLSLIFEVDIVLALCLASKCRGCILLERGVVYSQIIFTPILYGDPLCGKSCVDELAEILLCEGRDVELCP